MQEQISLSLDRDELLMLLRTLLAVRGVPFAVVKKPDLRACDNLIRQMKSQKSKGSGLSAQVSMRQTKTAIDAIKALLAEFPEGAVHTHTGFWPKELIGLRDKLDHEVSVAT